MAFRVGKYKYKSQKAYERLLIRVGVIFVICLYLLFVLRDNMNTYIYCFTVLVDILMIAHLGFRFLHSKNKLRYVFNEY